MDSCPVHGEPSQLVARRGLLAPGADALFSTFSDLHINENGRVAFEAKLFGDHFGSRIWAESLAGDLQMILRGNEMFDVGGGDMRQISNLFLEQFLDDGILLFRARFDDGSMGYFTSDLVAVPEPTTVVLLLISVFAPEHQLG